MTNIEFEFEGTKYSSMGNEPIIIPSFTEDCWPDTTADLDVKCIVHDESGKRYIAEFIVPHLQLLMGCDQGQYYEYIMHQKIPYEYLNGDTAFDVLPANSKKLNMFYGEHLYGV